MNKFMNNIKPQSTISVNLPVASDRERVWVFFPAGELVTGGITGGFIPVGGE